MATDDEIRARAVQLKPEAFTPDKQDPSWKLVQAAWLRKARSMIESEERESLQETKELSDYYKEITECDADES